jgi:hypothetical protein
MKYANCLYLDKGTITGALRNASHMHKKIWSELTKIEEQNSVIINNQHTKQLKYDTWCNYSNIIISLLVIVIIIMFYMK